LTRKKIFSAFELIVLYVTILRYTNSQTLSGDSKKTFLVNREIVPQILRKLSKSPILNRIFFVYLQSKQARHTMHISPFIKLAAILLLASCTAPSPKPYGPVPTKSQLEWQQMEINMFCHFGPNTFTDAEWGSGEEDEHIFNPTSLDCNQWVDVATQAGMGGIILTAKHHDGFCLWPSEYSTHTVSAENDVLRRFVDACKKKGMKAGVYISPWDRNHPTYGTDKYNDVFDNTLREVHSTYGPLFEQWFDGACGEGPNGKIQHYDWSRFISTMHEISPSTIIFSDIGPGCRWVGNEDGHAGETCWSTLHTEGSTPSDNKPSPEILNVGQKGGASWVPAEVDVSIRPGWFWHSDEHPKSVDELMEIYFNSVGRNGLLLLNVPPDTTGRIAPEDSLRLVEFRTERDRIFATDLAQNAKVRGSHLRGKRYKANNVLDTSYHTYWAAADNDATLTIDLDSVTIFDIIEIQEYIPLGQRVTSVGLSIDEGDGVYPQTTPDHPLCTTVGYKRLIRCDNGSHWHTDHIELHFHADAPPIITRIALYNSQKQ